MNGVWLTTAQAREIAEHARRAAPLEACGLIGGVGERALRVMALENTADDPRCQFRLDDHAFVSAMYTLQDEGLALIGIYHSHPEGDPIPSPVDVRQAAYPDTAYVIVGLGAGEPRMAAWQIAAGRVEPIDVHIGAEAPSEDGADVRLSPAQKAAIVASAVLAFVFMIMLSLSLLPLAPTIPVPLR